MKKQKENKGNRVIIDDLSTTDITYLAEEYIHHDRNRRIFYKKYLRGMTYREIADTEYLEENVVISEDQIANVLKENLDKVLKHVEIKDGTVRVAR